MSENISDADRDAVKGETLKKDQGRSVQTQENGKKLSSYI